MLTLKPINNNNTRKRKWMLSNGHPILCVFNIIKSTMIKITKICHYTSHFYHVTKAPDMFLVSRCDCFFFLFFTHHNLLLSLQFIDKLTYLRTTIINLSILKFEEFFFYKSLKQSCMYILRSINLTNISL